MQRYLPALSGTILPAEFFDPEKKANELHGFLNLGPANPNDLMQIFCSCVNSQRQQIRAEFKKISGQDLESVLEKKLHTGDFKDVMIRMLYTPPEFDARELRHAMKGPGMKEAVLIEIFCSRKITHLEEVKKQYEKLFGRNLLEDVRSETKGHFLKLCESLLEEGRNEPGRDLDPMKAVNDAKALFYAESNVFLVEESIFLRILAQQSIPQLQTVFEEYHRISGSEVEDKVKQEIHDLALQKAYLTICQIVRNPAEFFAQALENSMRGVGTRDRDLKRIIISRSETDMVQIKTAYKRMFQRTLEDRIKSDTSGPYEKILLRIVQESSF